MYLGDSDSSLDCSGADSASASCWPTWVNIFVPIAAVLVWVGTVAIMFVCWPKQPDDAMGEPISSSTSDANRAAHFAEINVFSSDLLSSKPSISSSTTAATFASINRISTNSTETLISTRWVPSSAQSSTNITFSTFL